MDLTVLTAYADQADAMPLSAELGRQCHSFADYLVQTKWHRDVRDEAKALTKRFRRTADLCAEVAKRQAVPA